MFLKITGMATLTLALLAAALSSAEITPAKADVLFSQKFKYFRVRGKTSSELFKDFQRKSPIKAKGKYDATLGVATIELTPEVEYLSDGKKCKVAKARVNANVVIHLPKWVNYKGANKIAKLSWDTLLADIKRHELVHAAIAKDYATRIQRKIESYNPRKNCEQLEASLKRGAEKILAKHDRAQRRFDKKEYKRLLKRRP